MNKNLKLILTGQTITLCLYTIFYLFVSFIIFEFKNPFQWIVNIPIYNETNRFHILFSILFYYTVLYTFLN
jgi:hypothetical protein